MKYRTVPATHTPQMTCLHGSHAGCSSRPPQRSHAICANSLRRRVRPVVSFCVISWKEGPCLGISLPRSSPSPGDESGAPLRFGDADREGPLFFGDVGGEEEARLGRGLEGLEDASGGDSVARACDTDGCPLGRAEPPSPYGEAPAGPGDADLLPELLLPGLMLPWDGVRLAAPERFPCLPGVPAPAVVGRRGVLASLIPLSRARPLSGAASGTAAGSPGSCIGLSGWLFPPLLSGG